LYFFANQLKNPELVESVVQLMSLRIGSEIERIETEKITSGKMKGNTNI